MLRWYQVLLKIKKALSHKSRQMLKTLMLITEFHVAFALSSVAK